MLYGLGEEVPIACQDAVGDVVGTVKTLVCHPYGLALYRPSLLEFAYHLAYLGLFALIVRVDAHAKRNAVAIEQKPHPHDGIVSVLL